MLPDAKIGPAIGLSPNHPESCKPEDVQAAREANDFRNYLFTDLYMYRRYRDNVWRYMVENDVTPTIQEGDMDLLKSVKRDFLGINYYQSRVVKYALETLKNRDLNINVDGREEKRT